MVGDPSEWIGDLRSLKKLCLTDMHVLYRASGLIPAGMIGKDLGEMDPGKPDYGQKLEKFAKADTWFSVSSFVYQTIAIILPMLLIGI